MTAMHIHKSNECKKIYMIINNPNCMPEARTEGQGGIFWAKMHCDTHGKKHSHLSDSLFLGYCKDTEQKCRLFLSSPPHKVMRRWIECQALRKEQICNTCKAKTMPQVLTACNTQGLQITCHSKQVWWILNNAFRRTRRWRIWSMIRSTTI